MRLVTAHRILIATAFVAALAYTAFELRHADGTAAYVRAGVAVVIAVGLAWYYRQIERYRIQ